MKVSKDSLIEIINKADIPTLKNIEFAIENNKLFKFHINDFDWSDLVRLMRIQLCLMKQSFISNNETDISNEVQTAIKLIDIVLGEDKVSTDFLVGCPNHYVNIQNYHRFLKWTNPENYFTKNPKGRIEFVEIKETDKSYVYSCIRENKAQQLLWKFIGHNIYKWWS